jgi:hypothetical protein
MVEAGVEINAPIENTQPIQNRNAENAPAPENALNWNVSGTWLFCATTVFVGLMKSI